MAGVGTDQDALRCGPLLEQVGLLADDLIPERLILEPAYAWVADLFLRDERIFVVNRARCSGGFGEELDLARALHGDEEPGGFVDGAPDGEQAVVLQDDGFAVAEG